jgi:hypothetical protein
MPRLERRHCWVLAMANLLVLTLWISLPRPIPPGSLEDLYSHIRVGMTQSQVVELIWGCRDVDGCYSNGVTKGGESFADMGTKPLGELPPPQDIFRCVLKVEDTEGWEVEVTLGPGGVVTSKCSTAPDLWTYLRRRLL